MSRWVLPEPWGWSPNASEGHHIAERDEAEGCAEYVGYSTRSGKVTIAFPSLVWVPAAVIQACATSPGRGSLPDGFKWKDGFAVKQAVGVRVDGDTVTVRDIPDNRQATLPLAVIEAVLQAYGGQDAG